MEYTQFFGEGIWGFLKVFPWTNKREVEFFRGGTVLACKKGLNPTDAGEPGAWWPPTCLRGFQWRQLLHQFNDKPTTALTQDRQQQNTCFHIVPRDQYQEHSDECQCFSTDPYQTPQYHRTSSPCNKLYNQLEFEWDVPLMASTQHF